jgi:glutathione S-transferase
MEPIEYVDMATARAARGLRLIVLGSLPSPWSEAAKGAFHLRRVPVRAVRLLRGGDDELRAWTGAHNLPVALYDDEPPRAGWAEILALAEQLGGGPPLLPAAPELRVRCHGLLHEIAGEAGLGWSGRLIMIHGSLSTNGTRSFPLRLAEYLAAKYGYTPERAAGAPDRIREVLELLERQLARSQAAGNAYLMGDVPGALDVFLATFLTPPLFTEADCPAMLPHVRPAYAYLAEQLRGDVPAALVAHRALMYRTQLPWPIAL